MNLKLVIPHRKGSLSRTEIELEVGDEKAKAIILSECQGATDTHLFLSIPDYEFKKLGKQLCEPSEKASII